ncbi:PE-PGRS family protein [Strigomonas culicis]|uniref:PE-PGRS family protein n=1 Tax=Strigomonas culicis TaxID=28005 RepID=S9TGH7_9TRYP|nr:PE-PGRS family protein [Strigomonas culicis]|eukprot:EPY16024.1 PE-PGRS family protein [Strigomonas culicis]
MSVHELHHSLQCVGCAAAPRRIPGPVRGVARRGAVSGARRAADRLVRKGACERAHRRGCRATDLCGARRACDPGGAGAHRRASAPRCRGRCRRARAAGGAAAPPGHHDAPPVAVGGGRVGAAACAAPRAHRRRARRPAAASPLAPPRDAAAAARGGLGPRGAAHRGGGGGPSLHTVPPLCAAAAARHGGHGAACLAAVPVVAGVRARGPPAAGGAALPHGRGPAQAGEGREEERVGGTGHLRAGVLCGHCASARQSRRSAFRDRRGQPVAAPFYVEYTQRPVGGAREGRGPGSRSLVAGVLRGLQQ